MDTVAAQTGSVQFLIETPAGDRTPAVLARNEYGTITTGISPVGVLDAYAQLKDLIAQVASDLGATLDSASAHAPTSAEVTFGLTFSAGANVWVMKTGGEVALTVKLGWSRRAADPGDDAA